MMSGPKSSVKKLPPAFFMNIKNRLKSNIYIYMQAPQIEKFVAGNCKFLDLTALVTLFPETQLHPECFTNALEEFKKGYDLHFAR